MSRPNLTNESDRKTFNSLRVFIRVVPRIAIFFSKKKLPNPHPSNVGFRSASPTPGLSGYHLLSPAAVSIGAPYRVPRTMAAASATRRGLSALLLSSSRALPRRLGPLAAAAA
jgi:hypothetical protein